MTDHQRAIGSNTSHRSLLTDIVSESKSPNNYKTKTPETSIRDSAPVLDVHHTGTYATCTQFPQFSKLPLEMQNSIWKLVAPPPRIIPFHVLPALLPWKLSLSKDKFITNVAPSPLLMACKRSRAIMKKRYKTCIKLERGCFYLNGETDVVLLLGPPDWTHAILHWLCESMQHGMNQNYVEAFSGIKHLAFDRDQSSMWNKEQRPFILSHFWNLETLHFINNSNKGSSWLRDDDTPGTDARRSFRIAARDFDTSILNVTLSSNWHPEGSLVEDQQVPTWFFVEQQGMNAKRGSKKRKISVQKPAQVKIWIEQFALASAMEARHRQHQLDTEWPSNTEAKGTDYTYSLQPAEKRPMVKWMGGNWIEDNRRENNSKRFRMENQLPPKIKSVHFWDIKFGFVAHMWQT